MDSLKKIDTRREDNLNDSWVQLGSQPDTPQPPQSIYNGAMEKLLLEAQKESRDASQSGSRTSPNNSPKGPHSPKSDVSPSLISAPDTQVEGLTSVVQRELGTEWVWDWSSRPECIPPSDYGTQFRRPSPTPSKRGHKLSVRNSEIFGLGLKSLSFLLITHACTLVVGAAAMFIWMKRPCTRCGTMLTLLN